MISTSNFRCSSRAKTKIGQLGTSIVGIVENGVGILGKLFGFPHITFIENINKHYKGDSNHGKIANAVKVQLKQVKTKTGLN